MCVWGWGGLKERETKVTAVVTVSVRMFESYNTRSHLKCVGGYVDALYGDLNVRALNLPARTCSCLRVQGRAMKARKMGVPLPCHGT